MRFTTRLINRYLILLAALIFSSIAVAQIALKGLNSCEDIASVIDLFKSKWQPSQSDCRLPKSLLERVLSERSAQDMCFLKDTPIPILDGFSCVVTRPHTSEARLLDCFRTISSKAITTYKGQYENLLNSENMYLKAASLCEWSNGNAHQATGTLLPRSLAIISRFEFGFVSPIGSGRRTDAYVQHGFASVDQTIKTDPDTAIEYLSFATGVDEAIRPTYSEQRAGRWIIRSEVDNPIDKELNRMSDAAGAPVHFSSAMFEISAPRGSQMPRRDAEQVLRRLTERINASLLTEGFDAVPRTNLSNPSGASKKSINDAIEQSTPYGLRHFFNKSEQIEPMLLQSIRPCTEFSRGAYGSTAWLLPTTTFPGLHYGSLLFTIFSLGDCTGDAKNADSFPGRLMSQTKEMIYSFFENE